MFSFKGRWQNQTQVQIRSYSEKEPLTIQFITDRVLLVLKLYDKVNPEKVGTTNTSAKENFFVVVFLNFFPKKHFANDNTRTHHR